MNSLHLYGDDELVTLIRQHNTAAFEEIYHRFWDKLFDAAYRRLRQKESCEEIIQEIFTALWEKRATLELITGIGAYLHTAVKYRIIDYYRRQLTRAQYVPATEGEDALDNSLEENMFLKDLHTYIDSVVQQLPDKCRSVYQLSRLEHKSNKEIASLLNISEKTVEGHLTKALYTLRTALEHLAILLVLCFF